MREYACRNMLMLSVLSVCVSFGTAEGADIRVLVHGQHSGENIVYHYTVVNNGTETFNNFTIGSAFDTELGRDTPELGRLPAGWQFGREGETGTQILLDPTSTAQPSGWMARAYGHEGTDYFYLQWLLPPDQILKGVQPIRGGQTLGGFAVTIPRQEDPRMTLMTQGSERRYVTGHFQVGYWSNQQHHKFRGGIERQDTMPPALSISAAPRVLWPPNNKSVPITVTVSAKDDYDPQPEIKLEAITANEPLGPDDIAGDAIGTDDRSFSLRATRAGSNLAGRIYTITYSATDGTGNKTTASTTVTVPHDQRK